MNRINRKKHKTKARKLLTDSKNLTPSIFEGPKVSIHTVSQGSRAVWLKHCFQSVLQQDYRDITEWVIGNGSPSSEDADTLKATVQQMADSLQGTEILDPQNFPSDVLPEECPELCFRLRSGLIIKLLQWNGEFIGDVRQGVNNHCTGDYIVSFDDDDIYPEFRVSLAVTGLKKSGLPVLGSSSVYLYDVNIRALAQFHKVSDFHSTHLTMAFTREYARENSYGNNKNYAEEMKFLKAFKQPVFQLQPEQAVLQVVHGRNTFEKSRLIHQPVFEQAITVDNNQNPSRDPAKNSKRKCTLVTDTTVHDFLSKFFKSKAKVAEELARIHEDGLYIPRHLSIAENEETKTAPGEEGSDFAFYLGVASAPIDLIHMRITGFVKSTVRLAEALAAQGHRVHIYAHTPCLQNDHINLSSSDHLENFLDKRGVRYINVTDFPFRMRFKKLVLCELFGAAVPIFAQVQAESLILDLYGGYPAAVPLIYKIHEKLDYIVVRSQNQCNYLLSTVSHLIKKRDTSDTTAAIDSMYRQMMPKIRIIPCGLEDDYITLKNHLLSTGSPSSSPASSSSSSTDSTPGTDSAAAVTEYPSVAKDRTETKSAANDTPLPDKLKEVAELVQHKNPNTIVWVSEHSKGIAPFLMWGWPLVKQQFPNMELHCYHSKNTELNETQKREFLLLMGQEGVMDHGLVRSEVTMKARASAKFQLAFNHLPNNAGGVSVKEACALKCIPVFNGKFAYGDLPGIRVTTPSLQVTQKDYTEGVIRPLIEALSMDDERFETMTNNNLASPSLVSWEQVAEQWISALKPLQIQQSNGTDGTDGTDGSSVADGTNGSSVADGTNGRGVAEGTDKQPENLI